MAGKANIKKIEADLIKFKEEVLRSGYDDARFILFGSWARGRQTKDSDIDICVISKRINDRFDDKVKLGVIGSKYNNLIEPVAMPPEDLGDKYYTLASEIKKWGVEI